MGWLLSWPWWAVVLACWLPFGVLVALALGRVARERDQKDAAVRMLAAYERRDVVRAGYETERDDAEERA